MTSNWQPYREPLRTTLLRTVTIALIVGAILAMRSGGLSRWPMATVLMLWPAFGGHWVEIAFLNWLRPRISNARAAQVAARIAVWFVGGIILMLGMAMTAMAISTIWPTDRGGWLQAWERNWWIGGLGFISIELVVHLVFQLRGRPSFYDGRG